MILKIIKRVVFSLLLIYSFDLIFKGINVIVPINLYTLGVVTTLGIPGLIMTALSFFFFI